MDRLKLARTLREMRAQLQELKREARQLRHDLRAIREAVGRVAPPRQRRRRRRLLEPSPTSPLGCALAVLRASRRPVRIKRILQVIGRTTGRKLKRHTVESQLSRYVRKGRLVCRTGPAEFALLHPADGLRPRG